MRPGMIRRVTAKEILSTLRDRRAIISNLLIPFLILPFLMLGLPFVLGGLFERTEEAVSEVAVQETDNLPAALRERLAGQNIALEPVPDPFSAVESGDYEAALSLGPDFQANVAAGEQAAVTVYSKMGNLKSELVAGKIEDAVAAYREELVAGALAQAGLDPAVLEPISVTSVDASSQAEQAGGVLAWLIPFFILMWTLMGGQMVAIDATAGEKERGTLEALLVSPVRRSEVVVGKFLATVTFGLSAALMAILGYVLGGTVLRRLFAGQLGEDGSEVTELMGGSLNVDFGSIVMLVTSSLLMAALIAALLIGITMLARSFKEAQTYVAPLSFVLIIPIIGLQFADFFNFSNLVYLIPVLNGMLLMDDIVGGAVRLWPLLFTWGSTLAYTALLLDLAYRAFKREGVIFRT